MTEQNSLNERLTSENIINYLQEKYAMGKDIVEVEGNELVVPQFTTSQFNSSSSTLTAIASVAKFYKRNRQNDDVYRIVKDIAKQYFYNGTSWGLIPFANKMILGQAFYRFKIKRTRLNSHYLKNIGFNINTITTILNR